MHNSRRQLRVLEPDPCHTCRPHDWTTDCHRNYFATCAQMATHVMFITLLMPVALQGSFGTERIRNVLPRSTGSCLATPELQGGALQVEVPDCDMRCLRHRTRGLQNDHSMLRMQCGLGSYSCCDNLLGILLRHPSRAAATRGRNAGMRPRVSLCSTRFFVQPKTQWTHNASLRDNAREL